MRSNRLFKIFRYSVITLAALFVLLLLAINLPPGQRLITSKVNGYFHEKNIPAHVKKITLLLNGKIGIKQLEVIQNQNDTILYVNSLRIGFNPISLIFRKVKAGSLSMDHAVANLATNDSTGILNLIALFPSSPETKDSSNLNKKPWDIQVRSVSLENIRFTYKDDYHGIRFKQSAKELHVRFSRFSLLAKEVYAAYINLDDISFQIVTRTPVVPKVRPKPESAPSLWKFNVNEADLKNIAFESDQPEATQRMVFTLSEGNISNSHIDLGQHVVDIGLLKLGRPDLALYSSPHKSRKDTSAGSGEGFALPGPWDLSADIIRIEEGSAHRLAYDGSPTIQTGPDLSRVDHFNISLKRVKLNKVESAFNMNRISMSISNGLNLEQGKAVFHSDFARKTQLKVTLKTTFSHVDIKAESPEDLSSIIRKSFLAVPFSVSVNRSEISILDLYAFMKPSDQRNIDRTKNDKLSIQGTFSGSTESLQIKNLELGTPAGLKLWIDGSVNQLTDSGSAYCDLKLSTSSITHAQILELAELSGSSAQMPVFEPFVIKGSISRKILAPEIFLDLRGRTGIIGIKGSADIPEKKYILNLFFTDLRAGELAGIKDADRITGRISLQGRGFSADSIRANATVAIDKAGYKGYVYRDLTIEAEAERGEYTFHIISDDAAAVCNLTGHFIRKDSIASGDISGNFAIQTGNLHLYNDSIDFKGNLSAEFRQDHSESGASLSVFDLVLRKKNQSAILKKAYISFLSTGKLIKSHVESDFLKADFVSHVSLDSFLNSFRIPEIGLATLLDSSVNFKLPVISNLPDADLSVEAAYSPLINLFIADSLLSYNSISIQLKKETDGVAKGQIYLDKYRFMNIAGYATAAKLESSNEKTSLDVKTDSMRFGNIKLGRSQTGLVLKGSKADISLKINERNKNVLYDIVCEAVRKDNRIEVHSTQPQWTLNGYPWAVSPGQFLIFEPETKNYITDLHWKNNQSKIDLYGRKSDTISLDLTQVALSKLLIPGILPYSPDGILNGSVDYYEGSQRIIKTKMDILQIRASGQKIGDVRIRGEYLSDTLGASEGNLKVSMADAAELSVIAKMGIHQEKGVHARFENISLTTFEPFLQKYISGLTGKVNGGIDLTFPDENPELNGSVRLNETGFRIIPLNSKFTIPGDEIVIKNNEVIFDRFVVLDSLKKRLNVEGRINLNSRPDPTADLEVTSDNLQVMNTTAKDNPTFYGSIFINSKLNITGPVQKPSISGNLVLAGGTVVNYQYVENLTISETEKSIRFASLKEDQPDDRVTMKPGNNISNSPYMEASIEIDPKSIFNFHIDRGFDIGVHITGGGFLNYAMLPNNSMSLSGKYEISQGKAELKIIGWPRKNFDISSGSYLKWDGKVDDPELQIETISKVKGSYLNPVDNKNREVDFKVYMKLTNRLSQLEISFDVMSEDQYINTVLNSLSKEERMKQAINLLIFERIDLPNMAGSSDYVTQQMNQFWESQLNQFTKSAIKNVDISFGLNTYKGASASGGEQEYTSFTYEVKKELFNKRGSVIVSGKMNDNSAAGDQSSNVIDNFTFEYALDTNRSKFLKVYRQQNYEDLLEGEVVKSGIGFIYRKNYDRLNDIWRKQKKNPKSKQ